MLSTYQPSPEQKWQHEAHKARLNRLCAKAHKPAPEPDAESVVDQYRLVAEFGRSEYPEITQIINEIAKKHDVTPQDIISDRRDDRLCKARHEGYARARNETSYGYKQIAHAFNRERTSVIYGISAYRKRQSEGCS